MNMASLKTALVMIFMTLVGAFLRVKPPRMQRAEMKL